MRERSVEDYLVERVEAVGGLCEKHVSPGLVGVPDELVTWPDGMMSLVETKRPKKEGGRLSPQQERDHRARAKRNVRVWVCYTKEQVDAFMAAHRFRWTQVEEQ